MYAGLFLVVCDIHSVNDERTSASNVGFFIATANLRWFLNIVWALWTFVVDAVQMQRSECIVVMAVSLIHLLRLVWFYTRRCKVHD